MVRVISSSLNPMAQLPKVGDGLAWKVRGRKVVRMSPTFCLEQ